jgi:hypothetical protein
MHQDSMMVYAIAAVFTGASGVVLLYASWRKRLRPKRLVVPCGWSLIAISFWFWIRFAGAEFGTVIAAMQLSIVAWIFVLTNRHMRRSNGRQQEPVAMNLPRFQAILHHSSRFLIAVPLAAGAGTMLVLAASILLPWSDANRLAFAVLVMPLMWGVLAYWACLDTRLLRPALGLVAAGTLGAAVLYI